jgi:hypothetical protein
MEPEVAPPGYEYNLRVVPDDPAENAFWRTETLRLAAIGGENFQKKVLDLCLADFWYWSKGFAYVHEPRILDDAAVGINPKVPYLPWPHQIPVVDRILAVLGKRDLRVVKSRAQGASWIVVLIFLWCWLFWKGFKGNLVSKDEDSVDRRHDMNALMPKADWLIEQLPVWMVGKKRHDWVRNHQDHTLARMDGETAITGFACTADVASGGRATVFAMDEHAKHPRGPDKDAMAATQPISRCRLFISTPRGMGGAFYEIVHDDSIEEPVLRLDWKDNPTQNRNLYRLVSGLPVAIDPEKYGDLTAPYTASEQWSKIKSRLEDRGYDLTNGRPRSPWYDQECLRPGANPVLIAQEYDMDFGSSVARYFAEALVNRLKTKSARPSRKGEFWVNRENLIGRWSWNDDGRFSLWCDLDIRGNPPMGEYIVGCDVASGLGSSGASNSAISVFNRRNGEKVASFASSAVLPYDFAEIAIGMCNWFVDASGRSAFLIWEANGYGGEFKTRVERSGFHFYYRRKTKDANIFSKSTEKAGYWTAKRSDLFGPYREALIEGFFNNHDLQAIEELAQFEMGPDGEPIHPLEKSKHPTEGKAAHGDRVTADALVYHASLTFGDQQAGRSESRQFTVNNVQENLVPANSAAWRRARYLDLMRRKKVESRW